MKIIFIFNKFVLLLFFIGFFELGSIHAQENDVNPNPTATPIPSSLIFDAEPGPDTLTLQEITVGATNDEQALEAIIRYYNENRERLGILWREEHSERLAGLFSMYVVHISTIYGETPFPTTFLEYLGQTRADCGTYTWAQVHIADALGLTYRFTEFLGEHAWTEIQIDGHWEIFDATTNTWLSSGVDELMLGAPRNYRQFYTPLLDMNRPDARYHIAEGYDMQRLRQRMPTLGIIYMPPGELFVSDAVQGKGDF